MTLFSCVSFNLLGCRSASSGMGVNGTTFPAQTDAVNPSQAIRPKPPNEECHLPPSLSGLQLVCPILTTTSGLGFPVGSRTVWSCKGWDNETQPNPALSHITAMNMKFPTANTELKIRLWTLIFFNWHKKMIFHRICFVIELYLNDQMNTFVHEILLLFHPFFVPGLHLEHFLHSWHQT